MYEWTFRSDDPPIGPLFMGIYHHPPPAELQAVGVDYRQVKETWTNEAIAFASSYAAKTALWLRRLP